MSRLPRSAPPPLPAKWRRRLPHFTPARELRQGAFVDGEKVFIDYHGQFDGGGGGALVLLVTGTVMATVTAMAGGSGTARRTNTWRTTARCLRAGRRGGRAKSGRKQPPRRGARGGDYDDRSAGGDDCNGMSTKSARRLLYD